MTYTIIPNQLKVRFYQQQKYLMVAFFTFYTLSSLAQGCIYDAVEAAKQPTRQLDAVHATPFRKFELSCPPVGEQNADCRDCVAWAVCYYGLSIIHKEIKTPYSPYFICNQTNRCVKGMSVEEGFEPIASYAKEKSPTNRIPRYSNWEACTGKKEKSESTLKMQRLPIDSLLHHAKQQLGNFKHPIILVIPFSAKLRASQEEFIRPEHVKNPTDKHAVCVVGYDDSKLGGGYLLIVNSWGKAWGKNGFAKIALQDIRCRFL